jgi:hypothetical protein
MNLFGGVMMVALALPWVVIFLVPVMLLVGAPSIAMYTAYKFIAELKRRQRLTLHTTTTPEFKYELSA